MEEENIEKKRCDDCRYFFQHYGLAYGKIYKVYCGHCVCEKIKDKGNRRFIKVNSCEFYEPREALNEQRRKKIKDTIMNIEKSLNEIVLILKLE